MSETSTALVSIGALTPTQLFTEDKMDPLLAEIIKEVKSHVPDISTVKGRKEIASLALKVAKSKTYLDDLGKDLVSEWKDKSKKVDEVRKRMREQLDSLKEEARRPLTEFEEKEEARIQKHEAGIATIEMYKINYGAGNDKDSLENAIYLLSCIEINDSWDEFKSRAEMRKNESMLYLKDLQTKRQQYDNEQAELKRLREQEEARLKKEREDQIAKEAADKAKAQAEENARVEAEKAEKQKQEELRKAKEETDRIEAEKQEAIRNQKLAEEKERLAIQKAAKEKEDAERERVETLERHEREKAAAEDAKRKAAIKAEKDKAEAEERARENERIRIQKEKEREQEEVRLREANLKHRRLVNNDVLTALKAECGLDDIAARAVIEKIYLGKIPNVKISY